jgi:hypothetical protein
MTWLIRLKLGMNDFDLLMQKIAANTQRIHDQKNVTPGSGA